MIRVWADGQGSGALDRFEVRGSTFSYERTVPPSLAVSLTMPPRTASWNTSIGLAPIFEMNLPEGALRERLRLAFGKATGSFDDIDLLTVVGRSQIGRLRFTGMEDELNEAVPFESVDEILASRVLGQELPDPSFVGFNLDAAYVEHDAGGLSDNGIKVKAEPSD